MKYNYLLKCIFTIFPVSFAIDGIKLMNLIDCFAFYLPNASLRSDNSQTSGCLLEDIIYCKTDSGHNDHYCKFDGTNKLTDLYTEQNCYYNCQMETCNAFDVAHNDQQQECINKLES